jgi:hypothetical protein
VVDRDIRVGKNEALFREVNERIREITTYDGGVEFLCECGDPECTQPIVMSLAEYESVRSRATRFVIVPGHEVADVERVVERTDRFAVVEKLPGRPASLAAETDPRS